MPTPDGTLMLGIAIVRVAVGLAPRLGFLEPEREEIALAQGDWVEAKEVFGAINARLLVVTWPLLALVYVMVRAEERFGGVSASGALITFALSVALFFAGQRIPLRWFRGTAPPILVLVGTTACDVAFRVSALAPVSQLLKP